MSFHQKSEYKNIEPMTRQEMVFKKVLYLVNAIFVQVMHISYVYKLCIFNRSISSMWRATGRINKIIETN